MRQGRIQDLIRGGGGPDHDRPKTAILGPQFCRILVLGPHFWWSGGARAPGAPPGSAPDEIRLKLVVTRHADHFNTSRLSSRITNRQMFVLAFFFSRNCFLKNRISALSFLYLVEYVRVLHTKVFPNLKHRISPNTNTHP